MNMEEHPKMTDKTVTIRLPEDLHEWLKEWSARNERSINRQIVVVLRQLKADDKEAAAGVDPAE
jgi:hypothetical protein